MARESDERFKKLREKAEAAVGRIEAETGNLSTEEIRKLIHDLHVHQIELEMQNEEMRKSQRDLEESRDRFSRLYNEAPVGYLTVDATGMILQANQTIGEMLGTDLSEMLRRPFSNFIDPLDWDIFFARFKAFFKRPEDKSMEVRLLRRGGSSMYAKLQGRLVDQRGLVPDRTGDPPLLLITVSDITKRKQAEEGLAQALEESRRHEAEVAALLEGARAVLDLKDFPETARRLYDICKNLVGASTGCLAMISEDTSRNELLFLDSPGLPTLFPSSVSIPVRGLRQMMYKSGQALYDNDYGDGLDADHLLPGHKSPSPENMLFAPLKLRGNIVGQFGLGNKPGGFSENDLKMASAFGEQAAIAFNNSQTMKALRYRLDFEALAGSISSRFINLAPEKMDGEITRALEAFGTFCGAERSTVFIFSEKGLIIQSCHEWCAEGVPAKAFQFIGMNLDRELPYFARAIRNQENVRISSLYELFESVQEYRHCTAMGIRSLLAVPLVYQGSVKGFVDIQALHSTRSWTEDTVSQLRLVGEILTSAMERKRNEEVLRENQENLSITLQSIGDGVITTDTDGVVTRMNRIAEALTGWDTRRAVGKPLTDVFRIIHSDTREPAESPVDKVMRLGQIVGFSSSTTLLSRDGTERKIADSGAPIRGTAGDIMGVVLVFRDITDQLKLEQQYRQAQKMEAVGQLAGGVAHDFNNLLQVMLGYIEMALDEVPSGKQLHKDLQQVWQAARRAATLVRQLLAFSRRQTMRMERLDLNDSIENLLNMVNRLIGEHIDLVFHPGKNLRTVNADQGQIEQILMNLSVNARDAMPDGGKIFIRTENVKISGASAVSQEPLREGNYVLISFADTGPGIPAEVHEHVFEPFFTTKEVGRGTGLGLATVYGIVKQHDGTIDLLSQPGKGAEFRIYLPASPQDSREIPEEGAPGEESLQASSSARGVILLAEDDRMVRDLALHILEREGFRILVACDGEEAMALYDEHGSSIDLALLDVVMPKASGRAVADHIKATRPNLPILFSTGYDFDLLGADFPSKEDIELVEKPYERRRLLARVCEMLNR